MAGQTSGSGEKDEIGTMISVIFVTEKKVVVEVASASQKAAPRRCSKSATGLGSDGRTRENTLRNPVLDACGTPDDVCAE
jgi:hypothetical protein